MESTTNLAVVTASRELARTTLRTRNIHALVRDNANLNQIKDANLEVLETKKQNIKEAELNVARQEYKLSQLDLMNPDYEDLKKAVEANLTSANEWLEEKKKTLANATELLTKDNLDIDKKIEENNAKIGRWEDGTNKVKLENLNDLAREYVEIFQNEKAKNLV